MGVFPQRNPLPKVLSLRSSGGFASPFQFIFIRKEGERESHPNLAKCQRVIQRRGEQQREAAHTGELFLISKCQHVL